jgi:hypothetical protein
MYEVLRAIIDSGASISIFNRRHWFRDFEEIRQPIRTAGKNIMSLGRGNVEKLHGFLYVPDLRENLVSVSHVCKDLGDNKCQFIDMKTASYVQLSSYIRSLQHHGPCMAWYIFRNTCYAVHYSQGAK